MLTLFKSNTTYKLSELKSVIHKQLSLLTRMIESIGNSKAILRFEFPIKHIDLFNWLHNQREAEKIYFSDRKAQFEMGGVAIADCIEGDTQTNTQLITEKFEERIFQDNPHLKFYGGFSFTSSAHDEVWKNFPKYRFVVPRFEIHQTPQEAHFALNLSLSDINQEFITKLTEQLDEIIFSDETKYKSVPIVKKREDQPNNQEWEKNLNEIKDVEKVVLARKSTFTFDRAIDPIALLKHLKDMTPNCFHFCFQLKKNYAFLGATPEQLFKRDGLNIETEALAGTTQRGKTQKDDEMLEEQLLNSSKDTKEHKYVVDEIYDCLTKICTSFEQDSSYSLLKIKEGQHLLTKFKGKLKPEIEDHQILDRLHPTPAVCGTPKQKALEIISKVERFSRGWYSAPIGYIGGDIAEFAVGIRSCLVDHDQISLFAGAGIIAESNIEDEWQELETKISNFMQVFNQ